MIDESVLGVVARKVVAAGAEASISPGVVVSCTGEAETIGFGRAVIDVGNPSGRRAGGNIRTWFTNRNEENERARNHAITHEVKQIPIRNGSRGEGIGMGHRNKKSSTK